MGKIPKLGGRGYDPIPLVYVCLTSFVCMAKSSEVPKHVSQKWGLRIKVDYRRKLLKVVYR